MNKLFVIGAMAFVIATTFTSDASAQWHNRYGYGRPRGGIVSNTLESMARTARRIERAVTGRNNYGYRPYGHGGHNNYRPTPVIVVPVQQRPVRRGFGGYW
jgi:hypothetical protein